MMRALRHAQDQDASKRRVTRRPDPRPPVASIGAIGQTTSQKAISCSGARE
jgi:hypothetical protein